MRIVFDACSLGAEQTGIGRYTRQLLTEMFKLSPCDEFFISDILLPWFPTTHPVKFPLEVLPILKAMRVTYPFMTAYRAQLYTRQYLRGFAGLRSCDLFFGTNFRGVFKEGMRTVLTVHDLVHEYYPETVQEENLEFFRHSFPSDVQRADLLIAVSEATRQDILKYLGVPPEKVKVIYNGVDHNYRAVMEPEIRMAVRKRYRLPEQFILMVGSIQPRKNIAGALAAIASLRKNGRNFQWKLVLVGGGGWKNEGLVDQVREHGLSDYVIMTGYVSEDDLPVVYSLADLMVFPSFYEGFGLPVVEAMACGVPVVTSNNSCLPEIAGDAAVLVDPHDIGSIADGIRSLLEDQDLRQQCIDKGLARARLFTWEDAARQTLQAFHELVG